VSIQATVQAGVETAFASLGDLVASVWLVRQVAGSYSSEEGEITFQDIEFEYEAIIDDSEHTGEAQSSGATDVEKSTSLVYMKPANDVGPVRGDELRINEDRFRILNVNPIKPNGVDVLLWEVKISR